MGRETEATDSGWSWVVALGMVIMLVSTTGQYGSFGLLFDDVLANLGQNTAGATLIMNALAATVNFSGLLTNRLLKKSSHRSVAVFGGFLFTIGVMLTLFADSMAHILICYSIISGIGLGLIVPSSYLAFNTYFSHKRNLAMGLCQAGIGVGFMVAPPLIHYLVDLYGFRGTMLILGGISFNSVAGALLYLPIKKKKSRQNQEDNTGMEDVPLGRSTSLTEGSLSRLSEEDEDGLQLQPAPTMSVRYATRSRNEEQTRSNITMGELLENQSNVYILSQDSRRSSSVSVTAPAKEYGFEYKCITPSVSLNFATNMVMFDNVLDVKEDRDLEFNGVKLRAKRSKKFGSRSNRLSIGSILNESKRFSRLYNDDGTEVIGGSVSQQNIIDAEEYQEHKTLSRKERWWKFRDSVRNMQEWQLLGDPIYVNIVTGLSISFVSDTNFFTILPFYLQSAPISLTGKETATCLSITAAMDICSRLVLPFITTKFNMQPRIVYMMACFSSAVARTILASVTDTTSLFVVSAIVGLLKGAMVVNLSLTIASYVNLNKFSTAYCLYMVINGVTTVFLGPLVGVIRDETNSFPFCINVLSGALIFCALTWSFEFILLRYKNTSGSRFFNEHNNIIY